jgi:DNA gyrase/topoisomerase IV subunit A
VLTGDSAAAPRYIEARLSKLALEILFSPKTTEWKPSYDGRNKEPITLPVKFPLLLAQGTEGIGVGLNSKILPHNFNEIIDAAVAYLEDREFTLYPDFPTGGYLDACRYEDGRRGGVVRIRAKINKIDNKTLEITEIPYGTTTVTLKDSIVKANPELIINDEEVKNFVLRQIFPGIDYATLEDDMKANLDKIAANYLKDEQQVNGIKNQLADIKMTQFLKGKMNINFAETTTADFMKKLEEDRKAK